MYANTKRFLLLFTALFALTFAASCGEKKADPPTDAKPADSKPTDSKPADSKAEAAPKGLDDSEQEAVRDEFDAQAETNITAENADKALSDLEKELAEDL